jgi:hypothetical protein
MSCKKAWEALKQGKTNISEEIDAKKETLADEAAWQKVKDAKRIYVASGKKTLEFIPNTADKDEIMKKILGRTGNLRAPTLRRGDTFFVGYNDDLYQQLTSS